MKLYCVRHGEANTPDIDPKRGLTEQGQLHVAQVAEFLSQAGVSVAHVMHSPKQRAKQTAEILARHLSSADMTECDTILDAESPVAPMVDMIRSWSDDTMLVGHLPFMPKLISALVIENDAYVPIVQVPPATVVCLDYYSNYRWVINWIINPNIVNK